MSNSLNIVHVYKYFLSVRGGVEKYVEELAKHQAKQGHTVTIVACESPINKRSIPKGVNYIRYGSIVIALKSILVDRQYPHADIVHIHGFRTPFSAIFGLAYKFTKNSILIMTPHGITPPFSFPEACQKKLYDNTLGRLLISQSDALVAYKANRSQLQNIGLFNDSIGKKTFFVPNGVNTDDFQESSSPGFFRAKYGIPPEKRIVLFVGRKVPIKGIEVLIRAMSYVVQKNYNTLLILVGQGTKSYVDSLMRLAEELSIRSSVLFIEEITDDRLLRSAYSASTMLVLPTKYDVLPTVVLEALASGLPVITSRIEGTAEIIEDGVTGLNADLGDERQLSNIIKRLLDDEDLRIRLISKGKEIIAKKFSWQKNSLLVENIYKLAMKKSNK